MTASLGGDERASVGVMTEGDRPQLRLEGAYLDDAAAGLREVLRLARALGRISEEAVLLDLINTTACEKLGCRICAIAIRGDDGVFSVLVDDGARGQGGPCPAEPGAHCGRFRGPRGCCQPDGSRLVRPGWRSGA